MRLAVLNRVKYIYTPNPLQAGQEATIHIAGKATITIENGAFFCEAIVTPSGFTCPVKENFDFTTKFVIISSPNDPKNTFNKNTEIIHIIDIDFRDIRIIIKPINRQDALNGIKSCEGIFPNEITSYNIQLSWVISNPLVGGQESTGRIVGKATISIENGALYKITGFYEKKQVIHHEIGFCEMFVTLSGFTCPVKDDFDFTAKSMEATSPLIPKNTLDE
ncbi:hypothetical protein C1646_674215 [Rhizophagus diaphanus]|nr:hypothetical protein C1646_674215 [Rhizophagus diaphanus] [Rhizophagus sp. MUCL 43196]